MEEERPLIVRQKRSKREQLRVEVADLIRRQLHDYGRVLVAELHIICLEAFGVHPILVDDIIDAYIKAERYERVVVDGKKYLQAAASERASEADAILKAQVKP